MINRIDVQNDPVNWVDPLGLLDPNGDSFFGKELYSKKDYEDGRDGIRDGILKKNPKMSDCDASQMADDIMKEMTMLEGKKLFDLLNEKKTDEIEKLLKKIYDRSHSSK